MQINDPGGRRLEEVTVRLEPGEVTELLVMASQLDEGRQNHAILRDESGTSLALYRDSGEPAPLERHFDWWLGPVVLAAVVLMGVGAFTIARGIVSLLF